MSFITIKMQSLIIIVMKIPDIEFWNNWRNVTYNENRYQSIKPSMFELHLNKKSACTYLVWRVSGLLLFQNYITSLPNLKINGAEKMRYKWDGGTKINIILYLSKHLHIIYYRKHQIIIRYLDSSITCCWLWAILLPWTSMMMGEYCYRRNKQNVEKKCIMEIMMAT